MVELSAPATESGAVRPGRSVLSVLRERAFSLDPAEASPERRGFGRGAPDRQRRIEQIGRTFVAGYNAAVRTADPVAVVADLAAHAGEPVGFAFEGAAMGFALLDILAPWRSRRFARFVGGSAASYDALAYIGAGWALARTSPRLARRLGPVDPLLRWMMFDGHGFHDGFFHPRDRIDQQHRPRALKGYACNAYDQGVGRVLWFVRCANVTQIAATVSGFAEPRRADLWSGVGLAAAYAGGVPDEDLNALAAASGPYRGHVSQGAVFAAMAREWGGNPAPHTERACRLFFGLGAAESAAIAVRLRPPVGPGDAGEAYEAWRTAIREHIAARNAGVGT